MIHLLDTVAALKAASIALAGGGSCSRLRLFSSGIEVRKRRVNERRKRTWVVTVVVGFVAAARIVKASSEAMEMRENISVDVVLVDELLELIRLKSKDGKGGLYTIKIGLCARGNMR